MKNRILLSLMMFLQFMMLPVWFVPMLPYVQSLPGGGRWAMWCGLIMGFGTFAAPLCGMFADRFLNAEKVLALCNFIGASLLVTAFFVTSPAILFVLLLVAMCGYMPAWSLTATIALAHSTKRTFPASASSARSAGWRPASSRSLVRSASASPTSTRPPGSSLPARRFRSPRRCSRLRFRRRSRSRRGRRCPSRMRWG